MKLVKIVVDKTVKIYNNLVLNLNQKHMRNSLKLFSFTALIAVFFGFSASVLAYGSNLSITDAGGGNANIMVSNAPAYSSIQLSYTVPGSSLPTTIGNFGTTGSNGYFSTTISSSAYGINNGAQVYVTVGGQQSNSVQYGSSSYWGGNYSVGGLNLSQGNVNLNIGQSTTITAGSGVYNPSYYVASNSNSNVASAYASGNQITITGNNSGNATIGICLSGNSSMCSNVYVTVNGGYNYGNLNFSQNNITINAGQSASVNIYSSYSGTYYVSSNSNSSVVSASVSGATVNLYGQNTGSSNVTVCQNNGSTCGTIYVTVQGSSSGSVTFSQNNLNLNASQSQSVTLYGYYSNNNFYINGNTNSNAVSTSLSGSQLTITGQNSGSSTITVCQSGVSNCGSLYVNVSGSGSGFSASQNNIYLNQGQSSSVTFSGNWGSLNVSSNSNSYVATASLSGNNLNIYANNNGTAVITVCANYSSNCQAINVTVGLGNNYSGNLSFTSTNLPQPVVGQNYNYQLQVTGGNSPYTFALNNGSLPAGLGLLSNGAINGTPQNNNSASFSIRATDASGRVITTGFTLNPTGSSGVQYQTGAVLGLSMYNNGALISENGTVYIAYKNTKTGFASASVFKALGYNFANVINASNSGLADSGFVVTTASASHPWGSWIKSGATVYFVHELGLIPVGDYNTFLNNGGDERLVVPANSYDFRLPMLSIMMTGDSRLR